MALAILGLALGTVFASFRTGAAGIRAAAAQADAMAVAQSLLAAEGNAVPLSPGTLSGATADGAQWRVVTSLWGSAADQRAREVAAYRLNITVTKSGQTATLDTLLPDAK